MLESTLRLRGLFVLALALALAGCGSPRTHELLGKTQVQVSDADLQARHSIFVATTRMKAPEVRRVFDAQRSPTLAEARIEVTVPKVHKIGSIERPKGAKDPDPRKEFAATGATLYDTQEQFIAELNDDIDRRGGRVLVFVHGYNTGFDDAVYRITQLAHDMRYTGTPVLFSWASGGKTADYLYDRESTNAARDDLEATLKLLARTKAKQIDIIGHSMGTWLTMETLRQLAIGGDRDLGGKLGYVILASPDIDVDVFKKQMQRYGVPKYPFVVLLSHDDKALSLSGFIAGKQARVGDYGDAQDLANYGVVVVDLSELKGGDRLNHAKFADNPILVQLMGQRLRLPAGLEPDEAAANRSVDELGRGVGNAVGSVARIVVTTPLKVLTIGE